MRINERFAADLGNPDGQIFLSPLDFVATSGTLTATRNAAGDFSLNIGASQTCVLVAPLSSIIFRYGLQDWCQEQFGSTQAGGAQGKEVSGWTTLSTANAAVGTSVSIAVLSSTNFAAGQYILIGNAGATQKTIITSIPDSTHIQVAAVTSALTSPFYLTTNLFTTPAGVTGVPPFTGSSELTPVTSPRPKGIKLRQITPVYLVAGAALTTNTVGITQTLFLNNTANAVTNILANAANSLQTAIQTNPYSTPIQLASQNYLSTKYASYNLEWDVSTTTGGSARVYGVYVDLEYNHN